MVRVFIRIDTAVPLRVTNRMLCNKWDVKPLNTKCTVVTSPWEIVKNTQKPCFDLIAQQKCLLTFLRWSWSREEKSIKTESTTFAGQQ